MLSEGEWLYLLGWLGSSLLSLIPAILHRHDNLLFQKTYYRSLYSGPWLALTGLGMLLASGLGRSLGEIILFGVLTFWTAPWARHSWKDTRFTFPVIITVLFASVWSQDLYHLLRTSVYPVVDLRDLAMVFLYVTLARLAITKAICHP